MTGFFETHRNASRTEQRSQRRLVRIFAALPVAALLALSACSSSPSPETTGSIVTHEDAVRGVAYWGKRYRDNTRDRDAALNFASALRRTGQSTQAVAVLQSASIVHTNDPVVQAAYGKALAAEGQFENALTVIRAAQRPDLPDWKLISAEGAILDQTGIHEEARARYAYALQLAPQEPTVMSNLGMSHVLTGDLPEAEKLLRQAITFPGADERVRQNLSLVVGLQGRFEEAEQIAKADLPPEQAAANIAYLRALLTQENTWDKLKQEGKAS
ncbi:MAG: tetratricopeptide repeat protein [Rhizobiales bacterium]|nr:tetratricopeptide repeat protein [Hyphomicrobiales bacterium]